MYFSMGKIESRGETYTAVYAYFENQLSRLKRAQGNYNEAYELANAAYEKCAHFWATNTPTL